MHESGLMQTALDFACDRAREAGATDIRRIVLRVGEASGVDPDALRFAFEAMVPGTFAGQATLEIEHAPGAELELARIEVDVP
jgi:hydrogenase nickel incorporation protein HypA/HybF